MEMFSYYISNNTHLIILGLCITTIVMFLILIVNSIIVRKWKKKYYKFMKSKEDFSIEDVLKENIKNINILRDMYYKQTIDINKLEKHVKASIEKVALIKYDAFEGMGGELSFILALLNQEDTGILINGIHSREGCYTYIKAVTNGKCDKTLSNEEKTTLEKAIKN